MGLFADLLGTSKTSFTVPGTIIAETAKFTTGAAAGKVLTSDADGDATWETMAGGTKDITQATHGFAVQDVLYHNGTIYVKAKADAVATAEVVGIVSAVAGVNDFTLATGGYVGGFPATLTAGAVYYLSPTTAGALTATEPTTYNHVSKPILIAVSTTAGYFFNMRGIINGQGISPFDQTLNVADGPTFDHVHLNTLYVDHIAEKTGSHKIIFDNTVTLPSSTLVPDHGNIGQANGPLLNFYDDNNYLAITGCKVGINTVVPGYWLELFDNSAAIVDFLMLNNHSGTSAGGRILFNNYYGNLGAIKVAQLDNSSLADDGAMEFQTASNATLSTKMTILNTGFVGIGTAPAVMLHIRKDVESGLGPTLCLENCTYTNSAGAYAAVRFQHANSGRYSEIRGYAYGSYGQPHSMRIGLTDQNDVYHDVLTVGATNIGIGTTAPKERLHLESGGIGLGTAASYHWLVTHHSGQAYFGIGYADASSNFYPSGTTTLATLNIFYTGQVGIGVLPTASSPLRIAGLPTTSAGLSSGEVFTLASGGYKYLCVP